ncbi:RecX family transcriptional regulator [Pleomorphomonas sp. NRK KF1]|uniref:regulatory protein RecX n=1 Tax=Pleomorphomonas sp. NRK KF1 TaxID=2943000 RepID=UPI00204483F6|nr:RecX family transcriptional regulator [Pleomorphomonas sp. NRK KF1]
MSGAPPGADGWDRIPDEPDGSIRATPTEPRKLRDKLRRSGFAYLQRHSASEAHFSGLMEQKLRRWEAAGYVALGEARAADLVAELTSEFRELGLLDDAGFAASRVASARRKGASRLKIALGLRAKGVDGELARAAIDDEGTDETVAALRFCRRRRIGPWRRGERPDRDGLNREIAILARQGFATQLGRAVVLLSLEEAEDKLGAI